MKKLDRREFISKSAVGIGGALALSYVRPEIMSSAKATGISIGFQTYPIIKQLSSDVHGVFKMLSDYGYETCEMCSPNGYAFAGFSIFKEMKTSELKKLINGFGLECPSCHFLYAELGENKLAESIKFAHELGLSQMICSTFYLPKTATIKDYQNAADNLNKAAAVIKKEGLQAGFHNHDFEFVSIDGKLIYDVLMERFDPDLVKMQFQTSVIKVGYKAVDYFKKYRGRFVSAHLSDWTNDNKEAPVGQGIMDWQEFYKATKTAGIKNMFVEMSMSTLKDSREFLNKYD
ncbi:MAG: sugar phosphate isomerase/epimerase [Bacteroidales bacterium]|nr:sugar phosphate isomerase/epimerase [Bacteroidales bacterium]